jgi:hypothetical protein
MTKRMRTNPALLVVKGRGWIQESYETAAHETRTRASTLRKQGYRVISQSLGPQVTPVGSVRITMLDIRPGTSGDADLGGVPPAREVRWNGPKPKGGFVKPGELFKKGYKRTPLGERARALLSGQDIPPQFTVPGDKGYPGGETLALKESRRLRFRNPKKKKTRNNPRRLRSRALVAGAEFPRGKGPRVIYHGHLIVTDVNRLGRIANVGVYATDDINNDNARTLVKEFRTVKEAKAFLNKPGWNLKTPHKGGTGRKLPNPRPKRNPGTAADVYQMFHGKASTGNTTHTQREHYHSKLAELGSLIYLKVRLESTGAAELRPKGVTLALTKDKGHLYFVGGDQELNLSGLGLRPAMPKDHIIVGRVFEIEYHTTKVFHNFRPTDYRHRFSGPQPILAYDVRSKRLYLVGGSYRVTPLGIEH